MSWVNDSGVHQLWRYNRCQKSEQNQTNNRKSSITKPKKKREYVCFVCASFHESRFRGVNLLLAELSSTVWNVALPSLLSFVSLFYYSSRPYSIDPVPVLATLHVTVIARIISFSVMWGIVSSARHCSLHSHTLMIIQLHTYWVGLVRRQRNTL